MKRIGWPGKGYKFTCHRCGFWFPSTQIKKEWTGSHVCPSCFETRHPQTLLKVRGEEAFPPVVSKDTDVYVFSCDAYSILPRADFGAADCATVGNMLEPDIYQFRYSAVAAYAIAGIAITGMP